MSSVSSSVGMDDPVKVFSEVIQRSCHSICATWLEKEFFLVKGNTHQVILESTFINKCLAFLPVPLGTFE